MHENKEKIKEELITVDELAAYLHFSKKTIYNMVKEKALPVIRIGDSLRFSRSEIDELLQRRNKKMINILVIDDTESVCNVMRRVLENEGHTTLTATSGKGGLEHLAEIKFDHIFLDLYMPDMNGVETLRRIREMDTRVPVTIITGRSDSMLIQQAELYGIQKVICKPFSTRDVLAAISN
jgi:excisionase family DNA binding protein